MRWNLAQRLVLVTAYGLVLAVAWQWIDAEAWRQFDGGGGWISEAPNRGVLIAEGDPELRQNDALRRAVQLLVIALWVIPSMWLLRTPRDEVPADALSER